MKKMHEEEVNRISMSLLLVKAILGNMTIKLMMDSFLVKLELL